jgi:lysophospholipase L1-like esterase
MPRPAAALAAVVLVAAALLAGCSGTGAGAAGSVSFAVAGDSLTAWDDQSFPEPDGDLDPVTWTHWAIQDGLVLAGGYARGFASASDIAGAMVEVDADVLVVMVGTNDTGVTDPADVFASIDEIVATAGIERVLISAIPPDDGFADDAVAYNVALEAFAGERGWSWVDPWEGMGVDGVWAGGLSSDGIHPTADAAADAGEIMAAAIRSLAAEG